MYIVRYRRTEMSTDIRFCHLLPLTKIMQKELFDFDRWLLSIRSLQEFSGVTVWIYDF